jgi:hypothetical protein
MPRSAAGRVDDWLKLNRQDLWLELRRHSDRGAEADNKAAQKALERRVAVLKKAVKTQRTGQS